MTRDGDVVPSHPATGVVAPSSLPTFGGDRAPKPSPHRFVALDRRGINRHDDSSAVLTTGGAR